jgi:hypothetical protein
MGTPAPSNVGDHDDAESLGAFDMPKYDLPAVPGAHERSRNCLENKYHTEFFSHYADPTTLRSQRWGPTGGNRDLVVKDFAGSWASRLQTFNVSIASHPDCLLHQRLWHLATKGVIFVVDGHNGGGGQMTSIACVQCGAVLHNDHPGLPPKGGKRQPAQKIFALNQQITKFFWNREAILRRKLFSERHVCTVELHDPGSVIDHDDRADDEDDAA